MHEVVLIGYGSIGARHYTNLKKLGCDVVAVADPRFVYENVDTLFDDVDGTSWYSNVDACLKQHAEDRIVVIASPTQYHEKQFAKSRFYGAKAVFIEKPLYYKYPDVWYAKTPATVGHNYRFHPVIKRLKNTIAFDPTATLIMMAYDDVVNWPNYSRDSWLCGEYGGTLLTSASHSIDTALYLMGPVDSVWCKLYYNKKLAESDTGVDLRLAHSSGASTNITIRWEGPKVSTLAYVGKKHIGTFNLLAYNHDMHLEMMKSFLDYMDGKPSEVCKLEEGLEVMKIIDAARKSKGAYVNV